MIYYAVHKGYDVGIFHTWGSAERVIKGYSGAVFKKFSNIEDAEYFVKYGEIKPKGIHTLVCTDATVKQKPIRNSLSKLMLKTTSSVPSSVPLIASSVQSSVPLISSSVPSSVPLIASSVPSSVPLIASYYSHGDYDSSSPTVHVYCDGGVIGNGTRHARGGYGVFIPKTDYFKEHIVSEPLRRSKITNNVAELSGVIKSLELILLTELELKTSLTWVINYDSTYAVDVITGKKASKANLDLVKIGKELLTECTLKQVKLRFNHVYSHTSNTDLFSLGNSIVDVLAGKNH
jgi:ribonuclease HI